MILQIFITFTFIIQDIYATNLLSDPAWALLGQAENSLTCGKSNPTISKRIIGGEKAEENEFPWMVEFFRVDKNMIYLHCGGSLISENYILSAAHGFRNEIIHHMTVGIRQVDPGYIKGFYPRSYRRDKNDYFVKKISIHNEFEKYKYFHDIAIVQPTERIKLSDSVSPICLPRQRHTKGGNKFIVAGFGYTTKSPTKIATEILKKTEVIAMKPSECSYAFSIKKIGDWTICADDNNIQGIYNGDSGGPLMREELYNGENRYFLYGIVSSGHFKNDVVATYTDVYSHLKSVFDIVNKYGA